MRVNRRSTMLVKLYLFYLCSATTWEIIGGQDVDAGKPTVVPSALTFPPVLGPYRLPSTSAPPPILPTSSPQPSLAPTITPTVSSSPSITPTVSSSPSLRPSGEPSNVPSEIPTNFPTASSRPSLRPSLSPSISKEPSDRPSTVPSISAIPSSTPSQPPSESKAPSMQPSVSFAPSISVEPSDVPSRLPSIAPSLSVMPSGAPSVSAAPSSSFAPSDLPSGVPSDVPSGLPSVSNMPTVTASKAPTVRPSVSPSDAPSKLPSSAPSFTPTFSTRTVGMNISGLVDGINRYSFEIQFAELVDNHTKRYWGTVSKGGTVVYNSTTEFISTIEILPARQQQARPPVQNVNATAPSTAPTVTIGSPSGAPTTVLPTTAGPTVPPVGSPGAAPATDIATDTSTTAGSNMTDGSGVDDDGNILDETLLPDSNSTISLAKPFFVNDTNSNGTDVPALNTTSPTMSPTTTVQPSLLPSQSPSSFPTVTVSPSVTPTVSSAPSFQPTALPPPKTWIIWYEQVIEYGERFSNDTRANTVDEIYQFPFFYDQKVFTNKLIAITSNQLAVFVEGVEVRDGSMAPSIQPSNAPSMLPSAVPSAAPTPEPTNPPSGDVSRNTVIAAVVVPVMFLLLLVFAGIIHVTRVEHDVLASGGSFEGEVIPLPPDQQDPGTPPGGELPPPDGSGGREQQVAFSMGTPTTQSLVDPSEPLVAQSHDQVTPFKTQSEAMATGSGHPIVVSPLLRTPSHAGSAVSEITAGDSRRMGPPVPGYMSGTGTFTPTLASLPSRPGSMDAHSRDSSFHGSDFTPNITRSGLTRAATTGGISSPGGRISPFQAGRGGIPTIPTAQLSTTTNITSLGGEGQQAQAVESEYGSESEELPSMTAFNLKIEDLDDL